MGLYSIWMFYVDGNDDGNDDGENDGKSAWLIQPTALIHHNEYYRNWRRFDKMRNLISIFEPFSSGHFDGVYEQSTFHAID